MKKMIVLASLALLSVNAFALVETTQCQSEINQYLSYDSDLISGLELPAGEVHEFYPGYSPSIGQYQKDVILYKYRGRFCNGEYESVFVVNPQTCEIEEDIQLWSE